METNIHLRPSCRDSIIIQKISLLTFERLAIIIHSELRERCNGYKDEIEKLHALTDGMNDIEILNFLEQHRHEINKGSLRYKLIIDLICNKDYLITLQEYNEGFFNRVKVD